MIVRKNSDGTYEVTLVRPTAATQAAPGSLLQSTHPVERWTVMKIAGHDSRPRWIGFSGHRSERVRTATFRAAKEAIDDLGEPK